MYKSSNLITKLIALFALCLTAVAAQAQSAQVFVSATQGVDSGACALANPCRNVNFALTQVQSGGQVHLIDSGNYSQIIVNKSVKIAAAPGIAAVITHAVFDDAVITISVAGNVTLSGLWIDGQGVTKDGVRLSGGKVVIENCVIEARESGIVLPNSASLYVVNSAFRYSTRGIAATPADNINGINQELIIERCRFLNHGLAGLFITPDNGQSVRANLRQCLFQKGAAALQLDGGGGGTIEVNLEESSLMGGSVGIATSNIGNAGSVVARVSECIIVANSTGLSGNGTVLSRGNNTLEGNTTNGAFSGAYAAK